MKQFIGLLICLCGLTACSLSTPALQEGSQTAQALAPTLQSGAQSAQQTAAALLPTLQSGAETVKQTAEAMATANPVDLQGAKATAEALLPTLQSRAPEVQATVEALATLVPEKGLPALATLQALTQPVDIPADLPLAQPATIIVNTQKHIMYTTTQTPSEVVKFYLGEMEQQGWSMQPNAATTEAGGRLSFTKDTRLVKVMIVRTGEATTVDLGLEER